MLSHKWLVYAIFSLTLLGLIAVGPVNAVPGICLTRTPAPPTGVRNDGASAITFNWNIEYMTSCNAPYRLEILTDPALPAIFTQFFPCAASPIINSFPWTVPQGFACGCYYGRLTFFSDWCAGSPGKFEDQALVGFLVKTSGTFQVCKRWDLNGDGNVVNDPPLSGWQFTVERPIGNVIAMGTTGTDGCVNFTVDVECTGQTQVWVREVVQPGWVKTTPNGALNPFQVNLVPGQNPAILVGNWQPILITGYKLLDNAPWPWTSPKYVGPQGQQNPAAYEPQPPCIQPIPPAACSSPFQPDQVGLDDVYVCLYDDTVNPATLISCTRTNPDGSFSFGPLQWKQNFRIEIPPLGDQGQPNPAPIPPTCDTNPAEGGLLPWPGGYFGTVASSSWPSPVLPCPNMDFTNPDELRIILPQPVAGSQTYGCNYFWNRQPSRLWGKFCADTLVIMPSVSVGIEHEGLAYPTPSVSPTPGGVYQIPEINAQLPGIRAGTYTLTLPTPSDPANEFWRVTTYCDSIHGNTTFDLTTAPYSVDVGVPHSTDVRVDFCLIAPPNKRRCNLPVTFTQEGWHAFCDPNGGIIPGGMVYNKFRYAFANFTFYGTPYTNKVLIGYPNLGKTITFDGTTSALSRLCAFFPQTGPCGKLVTSYVNPVTTTGGALAGELLALQMNIAYNDMRLMPRTPGYYLEKFTLAKGLYKGKTVREVRNIANEVLAGVPPASKGLPDCQALVDILAQINGNYEFVDYNTYNDNGYLIPDVPLGTMLPPIPPVVP